MNKDNSSDRRGGAQANNGSRVFLVDVEAAGPTPITGVMTEFGVVDAVTRQWFHGRLWDASPDPEIPAKPVPEKVNPGYTFGFSQFDLQSGTYRSAKSEKAVFEALDAWMRNLAGGSRVVLLSDNCFYDGMWMACAFDSHGLKNPFGHSARRIGDLAAGILNDHTSTSKWKSLRDVNHSHLSHEDSQGNAGAWNFLLQLEKELNAKFPTYRDEARAIFNRLRGEAKRNS